MKDEEVEEFQGYIYIQQVLVLKQTQESKRNNITISRKVVNKNHEKHFVNIFKII